MPSAFWVRVRNVLWVLARPRYLASWLYLLVRRRLIAPDEPWLPQEAIRFLKGRLDRSMNALEWGAGFSTAWLAERVGRLVSIEANRDWHEWVQRQLAAKALDNAECRFVSPESVERYTHGVAAEYADGSLDFVLVDDHYREICVRAVLPKIKPGGLLVIDNTDWMHPLSRWGTPSSWPILHSSSNGVTETTVWQRPSGPKSS